MTPRLTRFHEPLPHEPPQEPAGPRSADAALEAWLGMLLKLLRLPEAQARGIRDELEAHIRDRVRDLLITGCDEDEAMRRAIAELGEAAGLAQGFRSARRYSTRRTAMHVAFLGLAGGAALLGLVAVSRTREQPAASVFQPQPPAAVAELEQVRIDADFDNAPLKDVLEYLAQHTGRPSQVLWPRLEAADVHADTNVSVRAKGATVPAVLALVNDGIQVPASSKLEVGEVAGILSFGPREFFDRRDTVLVSYDLSGPIAARTATYGEQRAKVVEDVVGVITNFVSPDDWMDNGGDLAQLTIVGDRLFVKAPQRFHPQIRWIIGQLPSDAAPRGQGVPRLNDLPVVGEGGKATAYRLQHARAAEVAESLRQMFPAWKIQADPQNNSIIFSSPGQPQTPMDAILELDIPSRQPSAAPAAPEQQTQVVYLTGQVPRPGAFAVPDKDFSLRRLLAAAGGLPENATEVVITRSRNGRAEELRRLSRAALLEPAGEDPVLAGGDQVTVR